MSISPGPGSKVNHNIASSTLIREQCLSGVSLRNRRAPPRADLAALLGSPTPHGARHLELTHVRGIICVTRRVMNYEELKLLLDSAGVPAYLASEYDIKGVKSTYGRIIERLCVDNQSRLKLNIYFAFIGQY